MGFRPVVLFLVASAAACSSGSLGKSGTAGTSATGTGGMTGSSGVGGTFVVGDAGAGGTFVVGDAGTGWQGSAGTAGAIAGSGGGGSGGSGAPACGGAGGMSDIVEVVIADSSGMAVVGALAKTRVTVTAADSCATVTCPSTVPVPGAGTHAVSAMATRFVLTAPGPRTWTLYLRYTAMPANLVKVGDEFDLTVRASVDTILDATLNQTVVLGVGDIVLFASDQNAFGVPPLPALDAYGVVTSDGGFSCETNGFSCIVRPHAVRVAMNTSAVNVPAGITSQIGQLTVSPLTFTNAAFTELGDTGTCETKGHSLMAGFKVPIGGGGGSGGSGGGVGGTGGGGTGGTGTGGTGTVNPACPASGPADTFQLAIAGPDGLAHGSANVAVSVTSVDDCRTVTCPQFDPSTHVAIDPMATRIVLTAADARSWTLYLRYTALPADLIKAGDTLDMKVNYSFDASFPSVPGKTLVLSRGSDLVAFVWDVGSLMFPGLSTPQLPGVGIGDGGACGQATGLQCPLQNHAVSVTVGTTSARVGFGTSRIGSLTLTVAFFNEGNTTGGCDAPWLTRMAGFRTP